MCHFRSSRRFNSSISSPPSIEAKLSLFWLKELASFLKKNAEKRQSGSLTTYKHPIFLMPLHLIWLLFLFLSLLSLITVYNTLGIHDCYCCSLFALDVLSNNMRSSTFLSGLALFAHSSVGTRLFISSYLGNVTTVDIAKLRDGNYSMEIIAETSGCTESPSWLTYDPLKSIVYCSDEGLTTPNGTLSSFKAKKDGTLAQLDKIETITGGVKNEIYGDDSSLAVAF